MNQRLYFLLPDRKQALSIVNARLQQRFEPGDTRGGRDNEGLPGRRQ